MSAGWAVLIRKKAGKREARENGFCAGSMQMTHANKLWRKSLPAL